MAAIVNNNSNGTIDSQPPPYQLFQPRQLRSERPIDAENISRQDIPADRSRKKIISQNETRSFDETEGLLSLNKPYQFSELEARSKRGGIQTSVGLPSAEARNSPSRGRSLPKTSIRSLNCSESSTQHEMLIYTNDPTIEGSQAAAIIVPKSSTFCNFDDFLPSSQDAFSRSSGASHPVLMGQNQANSSTITLPCSPLTQHHRGRPMMNSASSGITSASSTVRSPKHFRWQEPLPVRGGSGNSSKRKEEQRVVQSILMNDLSKSRTISSSTGDWSDLGQSSSLRSRKSKKFRKFKSGDIFKRESNTASCCFPRIDSTRSYESTTFDQDPLDGSASRDFLPSHRSQQQQHSHQQSQIQISTKPLPTGSCPYLTEVTTETSLIVDEVPSSISFPSASLITTSTVPAPSPAGLEYNPTNNSFSSLPAASSNRRPDPEPLGNRVNGLEPGLGDSQLAFIDELEKYTEFKL